MSNAIKVLTGSDIDFSNLMNNLISKSMSGTLVVKHEFGIVRGLSVNITKDGLYIDFADDQGASAISVKKINSMYELAFC